MSTSAPTSSSSSISKPRRKRAPTPSQPAPVHHEEVHDLVRDRNLLRKCLIREYGRGLGASKSISKKGSKSSSLVNISALEQTTPSGRKKRAPSNKPPSEKQLASQSRFKGTVEKAKSYRQQESGLAWKEAMRRAFADNKQNVAAQLQQ